jgi:hypothetical protein
MKTQEVEIDKDCLAYSESAILRRKIDEKQFAEEGAVVIKLLQQLLRVPHQRVRSCGLRIDCVAFRFGFHDSS